MRTARGRGAWQAVVLALVALGLSAESCQGSTSVSTSGGTSITITNRSSSVSVSAGATQSVTANCQAGEVMLSGGYAMTTPSYNDVLDPGGPFDQFVVYADFPDSTTSWVAGVLNRAAGDILLTASVVCASGLNGSPTIGQGSNNMRTPASASCPADTQVTGGGYQITPLPHGSDEYAIVDMAEPTGTGAGSWYVRGLTTDSGVDLQAFSVCIPRQTGGQDITTGEDISTAPQVTAPSSSVNYQPTQGMGSAGCGTGQLLTGAGFSLANLTGSLPVTNFYPDYRATPPQWQMTLYSLPQPPSGSNAGGSAALAPICMMVE